MLEYTQNRFAYHKRQTIPVQIGNTVIGGKNPILIQSMTNTNTRDIRKTVDQSIAMAQAGCQLIRITTPTVKDATCLEEIVRLTRKQGVTVPFCADIHFQPKAAFESLKWVQKVRINPGNFVDTKTGQTEYNSTDFVRGEQKVYDAFSPFVKEAKKYNVAIRIGTNHGSLSDRIMAQYGDTVDGMVESALEFLRVCETENYHQIVFSMKASNSRIVIQAYRLLAARLQKDNHKAYPFHLGVTEAGDGQDGRLKSAAGIGALLLDGIGDTIRVSLTEDPILEIPVAQSLINSCLPSSQNFELKNPPLENISFYQYQKRETNLVSINNITIGGKSPISVGTKDHLEQNSTGYGKAEWSLKQLVLVPQKNLKKLIQSQKLHSSDKPLSLILVSDLNSLNSLKESLPSHTLLWSLNTTLRLKQLFEYRFLASWLKQERPNDLLLLQSKIDNSASQQMLLTSIWSCLLNDGYGDTVLTDTNDGVKLSFDILQASSLRQSKTDFISCPSCGRTLFDLEKTTQRIKSLTSHLSEISIAIMGCIVNGPGEMADADFGYVGGAPGKVNLYVGSDCIQKGIEEENAPEALVALIKEKGCWAEPSL